MWTFSGYIEKTEPKWKTHKEQQSEGIQQPLTPQTRVFILNIVEVSERIQKRSVV